MATPTEKAEILKTMRHRFKLAVDATSDSREDQLEDLKFAAGSPDNQWQWPSSVLASRTGIQGQMLNARPCLTINKLPQHVRQVTNELRQNRPSPKVIPANGESNVEVAEVFMGIIRHIEHCSDADVAYDTANENQVIHGEGYIRLLTEYNDPESFDQDIRIGRIRNPFRVYLDPLCEDPCGDGCQWGFITSDMATTEFESKYPKAKKVEALNDVGPGDDQMKSWIKNGVVQIAEYFYIDYDSKQLLMYPGGGVVLEGSREDQEMKRLKFEPIRRRSVDIPTVKWIKTNGFEILEENTWAGRWIPIIRVIGNEFEIDGSLHISGLIRNAKDAQRMYNYWASQEAEMLALAPKAPFVGYSGQFEGYESKWQRANIDNYPYLEVNAEAMDGQGNSLPLPQRAAPPMAQHALIQAKMGASDDIKATTGQYDSSIGATSNERSGRAIVAREKQSDTGTYHYGDNVSRGIRFLARQLVDLIPKIYDTKRAARIIGLDGETSMVELDPDQQEPVRKITDDQNPNIVLKKIFNLGVGKYDVVVTTGPSFLTKRQEAMEAMAQILQGSPDLWAVAGDLFVKNMDWPGAKELAARLKKAIDPKLLEEEEESPALQAANQQIAQMGQQMQQMAEMLQNVSKSIEAQELAVKEYDAETKRMKVISDQMTPEQVQQVVMNTLKEVMAQGDLAVNERLAAAQPAPQPGMAP